MKRCRLGFDESLKMGAGFIATTSERSISGTQRV